MGAIMNGLAAYGKGLVIPSGGTFLNFVSCESNNHSPYSCDLMNECTGETYRTDFL